MNPFLDIVPLLAAGGFVAAWLVALHKHQRKMKA